MAEAIAGLAAASSIIALIQITGSILRLGWSFVKSDKCGAYQGLIRLLNELTLLHGVLVTLQSQASSTSLDNAVVSLLNHEQGPLSACKDALSDIAQLISDWSAHKIRTLITKGPSLDKNLASLTNRIERLKSVLLLALHSDQWTLSHAIDNLLREEFDRLGKGQSLIQDRLAALCANVDRICVESRLSAANDEAKAATKALNWLSDINHEANHSNAQKVRDDKTGIWFINSHDFRQWTAGRSSVLWLNAIPGAGKTILFSSAVDALVGTTELGRTVGIAYFYFDFRDQEKRNTIGMLRCLVAQLARSAPRTPPEVTDLYDRYKGRRSQPSSEELIELLITTVMRNFDRVFLFLDALDECNERDVLLPALERIMSYRVASLFLTSRREPDIIAGLSVLQPIKVSIEVQQVAADVEIFLTKRMAVEPYLRNLSVDLKDEIRQVLLRGANGMFRWVRCQLDILKSLKRPKSIRNALKSLPGTLDETYERILQSVQGQEERELVRLALEFVIYAARPMSVAEVAEACVVEPDAVELDPEMRFTHPSDVLSGCDSLFILSGGYLGLAHYSIQEYLTSERILAGPARYFSIHRQRAMKDIAVRCIAYLAYDDFREGPAISADEFNTRLKRYPFLDYASNHWFVHCEDTTIQEAILSWFEIIWVSRDCPKRLAWAQVFCDQSITLRRDFDTYKMVTPSMLYFPGLWGLDVLCARLIELGHSVNETGGYYGTPLQAAAFNKHYHVVKLLINKGANVNQQGGYFGHVLQATAVSGHEEIARLLIENRAWVNTTGGTYGTPLQGAARYGHLGLVKLLVDYGAEVNQQGGPYGGALQAASNSGHLDVVLYLIERGASVNEPEGAFGTALQAACSAAIDHKLTVETLLHHGADPELHGGLHSLPLIATCLYGHVESAKVLLKFGANPNVSDDVYGHPLQAAAMNGHHDMALLLLERGARVNAYGGRYSSAIQAASRNGHVSMVKLLLKHGAEVNESAGYYGSALQAAARNGFAEVVEVLLDHGANVNALGGKYGNPLQAAASNNKSQIVKVLLERGANPNQIGGHNRTAIIAAAAEGHLTTVQLLLDAGADPGLSEGGHGTAFDVALKNRHLEVVKLLEGHLQMLHKGKQTGSKGELVNTTGIPGAGIPLSVFLSRV